MVSRDRIGRPVPRQPAHSPHHSEDESGAYSRHEVLLPLSATASIYNVNRHRISLDLIRSRACVPMASTAESPPVLGQQSSVKLKFQLRVLPIHETRLVISCPHSRLRIWSRETGSAVPSRVSLLHTRAESGAYSRDSSRVPRRRPFIYLKPPEAIGSVPRVYRVTQLLRTDGVHCRESAGTGPVTLK